MSSTFLDTRERYSVITRILHGGVAVALLWQFFVCLLAIALPDAPISKQLMSSHKPVGMLLMLLVVLRFGWSLLNRCRRPPLTPAARIGHQLLYILMLCIPLIALVRQYGSGRKLKVFGFEVMPGFDDPKIEALLTPANILHGPLGWFLLVLATGHAGMAVFHHLRGANSLRRMMG